MSGALMLDIAGLSLTAEDRTLLQNPQVGGLILFSRNYQSPQQLTDLISEIRACAPKILIAVDQEGGRVQRFREGFTRLPPMAVLGGLYRQNPADGCEAACQLGWLMAAELISYGVDISFAPVLDLNFGVSEVIGDRAFSAKPEEVTELAGAFVRGMRQAGMAATGKHFPGHGWVVADSHLAIPVDERPLAEIEKQDLLPFARLMEQGLDAVMPAHVIYQQVDDRPAGFSPYWIGQRLRQDMHFDGVVFSDDLTMEGASVAGSFESRAAQALEAGCDMLLVCNDRAAALQVLHYLEAIDHPGSVRIERMNATQHYAIETVRNSERWHQAVNLANQLIDIK
ncbi:beta-N-acetylhexosaminidase [Amphritea sp. 2_MG-2023]|jgi:beta-N-acetylhexosaminidase|uniref:beta-N-acetylhexosaminidase n=1 Tax=Amphritea TaxID=515417 RepID=UPI001C07BC88|nr:MULTISPECIES: beta-N-acetylhexosaminidase [Amphritea]MBU2966531.1 beta-N-acetylhexosaminidase [Amphritea atlantica]MDO6417610.1 beta-N-acetylhexosaminidase [Amphritea sp. 2_MG-2023]